MTARSISRSVAGPFARGIVGRLIPWTPAKLFAAGQQGVWYEPKPEYLFQDAAGTTPVTADGQPVGLMLDLHKGLALGSELVTNGTFDSDVSGWNLFTGESIEWVSGALQYTARTDGGSGGAFQDVAASGPYFKISLDARAVVNNGGTLRLAVFDSVGDFSGNIILSVPITSTQQTIEAILYSPGGARLYAQGADSAGSVIEIDNVSVRELPGNHATQTTAANKPLYAITPDQLDFDEVDDVLPVTFPVDMGTDVTIGRAVPGVGGEILTGQTVGTSYDITQDMAALIIVNETPSADNLSKLQSYLDTMAGV